MKKKKSMPLSIDYKCQEKVGGNVRIASDTIITFNIR